MGGACSTLDLLSKCTSALAVSPQDSSCSPALPLTLPVLIPAPLACGVTMDKHLTSLSLISSLLFTDCVHCVLHTLVVLKQTFLGSLLCASPWSALRGHGGGSGDEFLFLGPSILVGFHPEELAGNMFISGQELRPCRVGRSSAEPRPGWLLRQAGQV